MAFENLLTTAFIEQLNRLEWQPFREGVEIIPISRNSANEIIAALLRYQPHAGVPKHTHTGNEHIVVLNGSQSDEHGHYPAGSRFTNRQGSVHTVTSEAGCVVFITWEKPVKFL